MADVRFSSSLETNIAKLLEDKDAENAKRSTKVGKQIWRDFLLEKNVEEPSEKRDLALVLKSFYVDARKKMVLHTHWEA